MKIYTVTWDVKRNNQLYSYYSHIYQHDEYRDMEGHLFMVETAKDARKACVEDWYKGSDAPYMFHVVVRAEYRLPSWRYLPYFPKKAF